jgi:hypothetical protein
LVCSQFELELSISEVQIEQSFYCHQAELIDLIFIVRILSNHTASVLPVSVSAVFRSCLILNILWMCKVLLIKVNDHFLLYTHLSFSLFSFEILYIV